MANLYLGPSSAVSAARGHSAGPPACADGDRAELDAVGPGRSPPARPTGSRWPPRPPGPADAVMARRSRRRATHRCRDKIPSDACARRGGVSLRCQLTTTNTPADVELLGVGEWSAYGSGMPSRSHTGPPGGQPSAATFPGTVASTPWTRSGSRIAVSIALRFVATCLRLAP